MEGQIRKSVEPETFERYYAGCQVLDLTARHVIVAVPPALIERSGGIEETETVLASVVRSAKTDLLRDRSIRVLPLDGSLEPFLCTLEDSGKGGP